jgi:hypothetical protein
MLPSNPATPILYILSGYHLLGKTFEAIRKAKPDRLYLAGELPVEKESNRPIPTVFRP